MVRWQKQTWWFSPQTLKGLQVFKNFGMSSVIAAVDALTYKIVGNESSGNITSIILTARTCSSTIFVLTCINSGGMRPR